jgi:RNA-directed DNA polymerase
VKSIIELSRLKARKFLLKQNNYVNFTLPDYYSFQSLLNKLNNHLKNKKLFDLRNSNPRECDDINYFIFNNKDGRYAWRPFQIINPALYVSLVHCITEINNWKLIKKRFNDFQKNKRIECHSLPMISENFTKTDKESQIFTWWQMIEQKSITLSLDYKYILQTDITDCYSSIYTHSIVWALHTKAKAKKKINKNNHSLIGVAIDSHLQDMSYGQTNGIPQGSTLMDFIAEIVLGYVDELLTHEIKALKIADYHLLRYRDDYRIFTNNPYEAEQITKSLTEILSSMGLKLNASKTETSDNIIKNSIKPDKRYWIINRRIAENKQKWLIQLYLLSEQFPNSGTLETQMNEFLNVMYKNKKQDENIESLISLVAEIAYRNPRVVPASISILSLLLKQIKGHSEKLFIIKRIHKKFSQIPNSSYLNIWQQRLVIKIDNSIIFAEPICKIVSDNKVQLWNINWLDKKSKGIITKTPIIIKSKMKSLRAVVTKKEIENMTIKSPYDYE